MQKSRLLIFICFVISIFAFSQGRAPAVEPVYSLEAEIQPPSQLTNTSMMRVDFFNPPTESIVHISSETNSSAVTFTVIVSFLLLPLFLVVLLGTTHPKKVVVLSSTEETGYQPSGQSFPNKVLPKNVASLEEFRDKKTNSDQIEESKNNDQDKSDKVA
ncbi:hypothetical protein N9N67_03430 [Bacteriovoracaceae bacterium]|nr:hypothetical protein [Bacteriovoracaceae bacterium]